MSGRKISTPLSFHAFRPIGGKSLTEAMTNSTIGRVQKADEVAGRFIHKGIKAGFNKLPKGKHYKKTEEGFKKLFSVIEEKELKKGIVKKIRIPSLSAPVKKLIAISLPIAGAVALMDLLDKKKRRGSNDMNDKILVEKKLIEKTAEAIEQVGEERDLLSTRVTDLEKTAALYKTAEELAFKMVEKGRCPQFSSYKEFTDKVAQLIGQDMAVIDRALEMGGDVSSIGNVSNTMGRGGNPIENFVMGL